MAERIELTGNIWVHHPELGVQPVPNADPVDLGAPTSYAIKEMDLVTGVQTAHVYSPQQQLLSQWVKHPGSPWTQVQL